MPSPTQSRAKRLSVAVADLLDPLLAGRATVQALWYPYFAEKDDLDSPVVTVRPAARSRQASGKVTGVRTITLEIGVVRRLPQPASSEADPYNDNETIDALDLLSEEIFDMFCRVDTDVYDAGGDDETGSAGLLADINVLEYSPRTPEQESTLNTDLLGSDRVYLSLIRIDFQRME